MSTSLKTRMTLVVTSLVAGLVSVMALVAFSYFERQFKEIISDQQYTLVSAIAGGIDDKMLTVQDELTAVAGTITPKLLGDAGEMRGFLINRPDTFRIFDSGVYIFSPTGLLLASIQQEQESGNKDFSYLAIVQKTVAAKSPRISEPFFFDHAGHSLEHPFVVFTAPVFASDGQIAAVLAGSLNLLKANFLGKLADVKIGKRGYLYLYTTDRKLIIHPDRARVLTQDMPQPGVNRLFDRSMEGFEGTGETVTSQGLLSLSSFKRLKTTNWILAANFPRSEVYAPIYQAKRYLVGALVFVVLCSILVVRFFMQYLTTPLLAFTSRVREMTGRESAPASIQVSASASDEIATLAGAFNGMVADMERREKSERDQLHFLQILLDTMPNPVFYKDAAEKYLGCNRAFETFIGLAREELVGKSVHDIAPPELADVYAKADEELFRRQGTQVYEAAMRHADGTIRDVIFYKAAFQTTGGRLGGLIGTLLDITDRKRTEAALVEQTDFTENLIRNSAVPTFVLDNNHRVLIWNRACEELSGMKSEEVVGTDQPWKAFYDHKRPVLADFVIDGNLKEVGNFYAIHTKSPLIADGLQAERWFTNLNGSKRYIIFNAAPVRNGRGELIAVIETLEEITERKEAEEKLRESEMRLRAILDTAVDGIITINEQGQIESVNRSCERMFGYDPGTLAGRNIKCLMTSPFREEHEDYLARYQRTGEKNVIDSRREVVARREDGTLFPAELAVSEVRLGERPLFTGIISNITERKLREEELQRTLSLHVATLESTADGIVVVDLNGKIVSFNRKFAEMWRIPESVLENLDNEQALSLVIEQLSNPQEHLAKIRDLYSKPDMESSDIIRFKDGRIYERSSKPQRIRDAIVGRVWSLRDITEHRKLEGQLRQSQKMEALGTLAGGVAHDFNNILTAIIGFGSLLQRKMHDIDPNRHYVEQIIAATERAAGLTRSLLAYSRKEPLNPGHVDLNEIVRRVSTFLTRIIGEDVELEISLADETLIIMADSGQIEQILMNLATNARDAMAGAGSLVISTSVTKLGEEFFRSHGYGQPGIYALLAVSDDGSGMEPETRERIFEPFFTTKERGRGTGLGLSIVYGIVKQHHGFINVYSEPGRGTTFKVYFPLAAFVKEESKTMETKPVMGGTETILLIEDSREIRELLGEVLSGAGYTVIEAVDGQDGVEKFRKHQDEVQLLILDVIMPRKNGKEAYDEICKMKSDIRTIFTSGYTADIINRKGIMEGKYNFVAKPLSPDKLLLKIREVLAG